MSRAVGATAAGAGYALRFLLASIAWILPRAAVVAGLGLIVYGVSLFSFRMAVIVAGAFLLLLFWPRQGAAK